jgi:hypothetical protein
MVEVVHPAGTLFYDARTVNKLSRAPTLDLGIAGGADISSGFSRLTARFPCPMLSLLPPGIGPTMNFVLQPWHLLLTILAGLINRQQQQVIEYLRTENQVLKETHGKKRIRLNDDQRRRLAVKGKILGRKVLGEIGAAFSPDTILRWHRQLIAEKRDYSDRRKSHGRPRVDPEVIELVLRIAGDNSSWGYDRIQGALYVLAEPRVADLRAERVG